MIGVYSSYSATTASLGILDDSFSLSGLSFLIHKMGTLILFICIVLNAGLNMTFHNSWSLPLRSSFSECEAGRTQSTNRQDTMNSVSASSPSASLL